MNCSLFFPIIFGITALAKELNLENFDEFIISSWIDPPATPRVKIYVFNFTNPDEFLAGSKPKLEELGPYVFLNNWEKSDIEWTDNDESIEYNQFRYFKFLPRESNGQLRDNVIIPNIPMITALHQMKFGTPLVKRAIGSVLNVLKQDQFIKSTVRKILFGLSNPLLKLGNDVLPPEKRYPFPLFGLMAGKNGTEIPFQAKTGIKNRDELGKIIKFNDKSELDWWSGEYCNEIKGTDGFAFKANVKKTDLLHLFAFDLCRSIPLEYQKDTEDSNGIPCYRFVPPANTFGTPEENSNNACYCNNPDGCNVPSGIFNASICQFGSPVMFSWPHFFQADPKLLDTVDGLKPDQKKHQSYFDVQPVLGAPLRGKLKFQINIQINEVNGVKAAEGLRDILVPVASVSSEVEDIKDPKTIEFMKQNI